MSVCCECCLSSGRGLCDELITRPEKSYRMWCVVVCDLETTRMRRPWPIGGAVVTKIVIKNGTHSFITTFEKEKSPVSSLNHMNPFPTLTH